MLRSGMGARKPPGSLHELVDRLEHAAAAHREVSLDQVMDEIGRRSFGPLLLLAGLIMVAPVIGDIPSVPTILGIFVVLVAVQLVLGRDHFWLPQWLLKRPVSSGKVRKMCRKWLRRPARWIDRLLRPRWEVLTRTGGARAIAIASAVLALATPATEFVPFSANGVGAGIAIFGLALIVHDGLVAFVGWLVVAATIAVAGYVLVT